MLIPVIDGESNTLAIFCIAECGTQLSGYAGKFCASDILKQGSLIVMVNQIYQMNIRVVL